MSRGYTSNGKRLSSMTHASRSHTCELCGHVGFGNGAEAAHGRAHVRRGEAVELRKVYATHPPMSNRVFLSPDDARISDWLSQGYEKVQA